jgi:hypothetical protein
MSDANRQLQELLKNNPELEVLDDYTAQSKRPSTSPVTAETAVQVELEDQWTETEKRFARDILQPKLEAGEILWYMAQVAIYMMGQRYTMDFVAALPDGTIHYYEVKGEAKLPGEARQSVMLRWLVEYLQRQHPERHVVFKCDWRSKRGGEVKWHIREIKLRRQVHPVARYDKK